MKLVNPTTKEIVDLDNEAAKEAILGGFIPQQPVFLTDDSGKRFQPPSIEALRQAVSDGLGTITTQFDATKQKFEDEGIIGDVKAAAAGFARGATLGLSDIVLTKTGLVEADTLKAIEEASPIASAAGEVGSFFVPGTAVVKGAKLATKAGVAAAKGVAEGAGKKIVEKGIESAVRGGVTGAGQGLSDIAMEDIPIFSEAAAATVARSALVGAAFDTALTGAMGVGGQLTRLIPGTKDSVTNKIYSKTAASISGVDEAQLLKVIDKKNRDQMKTYLQHEDSVFWPVLRQKLDGVNQDVSKAVKDHYNLMKEEINKSFTKEATIDNLAIFKGYLSEVEKSALSSTLKKDLKGVQKYIDNKIKDKSVAPTDILDVKQMLNDIKGGMLKGQGTAFRKDKKMLDDVIDSYQNTIARATFDKVGPATNPTTNEQLGQLLEIDKMYSTFKRFEKVAKSVLGKDGSTVTIGKIERKLKGSNGIEIIEDFKRAMDDVYSASPDFIFPQGMMEIAERMNILADRMRLSKNNRDFLKAEASAPDAGILKWIGSALGYGAFGGLGGAAIGGIATTLAAPKGLIKAVDAVSGANDAIGKAISKYGLANPTRIFTDDVATNMANVWSKPEEFKKHVDAISMPNPDAITNASAAANGIDNRLGMAATTKAGEIQAYLASKMPTMVVPTRPGAKPLAPNRIDLRRYASIVAAATDPIGTIQRAAEAGAALSEHQLGAIRDLYPSIYNQVVTNVSARRVEAAVGRDKSSIQQLQSAWAPKEQPKNGGQDMELEMPTTSIERATQR
jgi:hypothetical protein